MGAEYRKLHTRFQSLGISHRLSYPHTHQQNGSIETGLTLLASASIPKKYWDEAFLTIIYLNNLLPSPLTNNKSSLEIIFHRKLYYNFLKFFGCAC